MTTNEDRGLEVAAGILKLVAERDMAVKCEQAANDYCTEEGARYRKTVDELQRQADALIGRAEKLEAAMLALVAAVEQGAPGNHTQILNEALIRCREESGMIGADLCDSGERMNGRGLTWKTWFSKTLQAGPGTEQEMRAWENCEDPAEWRGR